MGPALLHKSALLPASPSCFLSSNIASSFSWPYSNTHTHSHTHTQTYTKHTHKHIHTQTHIHTSSCPASTIYSYPDPATTTARTQSNHRLHILLSRSESAILYQNSVLYQNPKSPLASHPSKFHLPKWPSHWLPRHHLATSGIDAGIFIRTTVTTGSGCTILLAQSVWYACPFPFPREK